ncbi:MAG: preprotein translocase subunit SecG [Firmicutes bacterium]|nr:preprotein translocase subunit SecG [Bacillota bacterium]
MKALMIIVSILLLIDCLALTLIVLLQQGKGSGLSAAISGAAETYFGKNRSRTLEGRLEKWTKIFGGIFLLLAFVLYIIVGRMAL